MPRVLFTLSQIDAPAETGELIIDVARRAGVALLAPCNGRGICGRCAIRVVEGSLAAPDAEEALILARAPEDVRLACRARVGEDDVALAKLGALRTSSLAPEPVQETDGTDWARDSRDFHVAVDLGTTTIALALIDEEDRVVSVGAAPNRQAIWGADVLSRLQEAGTSSLALSQLRNAVLGSIVSAYEDALQSASDQGVVGDAVSMTVAANVPNMAIFVGDDGSSLLSPPYELDPIPLAFEGRASVAAAFAGTPLIGACPTLDSIRLVPAIGGFVGGDARAAAVAALATTEDDNGPQLIVDLGTNAEILLLVGGRLYVASAAGGPTFEGGGIRSGGPAVDGSIVTVDFVDGSIVTTPTTPTVAWMSGSGLISAIAGMLREGIVDPTGLMARRDQWDTHFLTDEGGALGFRITEVGDTEVVVDQFDVRAVQTAKSAVAAGIERLLEVAGISDSDLTGMHIAGAFGSALRPADLLELGIVPYTTLSAIKSIGGAALRGVAMFAVDPDREVPWTEEVAVTLSGDEAFSDGFMRHLDLKPMIIER